MGESRSIWTGLPLRLRLGSGDQWSIAVFLSALLILSIVAMIPIGAADDPGSISQGAVAEDRSADTALENRSDEVGVEIDRKLEEKAATGEEITVVLRLTELRDHDAPRLQAAAERPDMDAREELKSHAAATQSDATDDLGRHQGVEVHNEFWITNALVASVDTSKTDLEALAALPHVERIHENFEVQALSTTAESPADGGNLETSSGPSIDASGDVTVQSVAHTYGLEQINAPDAWNEYDNRGEGVSVAVLDTGIDPDHPAYDFDENNWQEWDDDGNALDSDPYDDGWHGTHVSGTVAGNDDVGKYIGVAPDAELFAGKVLDSDGGSLAAVISGIEWAVENEVNVINLSLGSDPRPDLIEPIDNARASGTVVVAAAGNEGEGETSSPGNYWNALTVGASDEDRDIAEFSNGAVVDTDDMWGDDAPDDWPDEYTVPHVSAPGVKVLSSISDEEYEYGNTSGTSMAAPHVSGTIALVTAEDSSITVTRTEEIVESTVSHPENDDQDTRYGYGIVDAYAAVSVASGDEYIEVADLEAPESVTEGDEFDVSATVTNVGDPEATQTVELRLGDGPLWNETVTLEGKENTTVEFENVTVDEAGEHELGIHTDDDDLTQVLAVEEADDAYFETAAFEAPETVTAGNKIDASVTVTNTGDFDDTQDVVLEIGNGENQTLEVEENVTLEAGQNTIVAFENVTVDVKPGDYQLGVRSEDGDTATTELIVETIIATYTDEDDTIQTDGLRDAIDDWRSGDIDTGLLRDVIDYWRSGEEISHSA